MTGDELRGAVAESSTGSIGIIHKQKERNGDFYWVGISFNGNPWSSRRPKILAYTVHEYIAKLIEDGITVERKAYLDALRRMKGHSFKGSPKDALNDCIGVINNRASERRELRKIAPLTHEQLQKASHDSSIMTVKPAEHFSGESSPLLKLAANS